MKPAAGEGRIDQAKHAKKDKPMNDDPFATRMEGKVVRSFRLENASGMHCLISNYGARLLQVWAPDRNGHLADVVLGHDSIQGYLEFPDTFFGATVGRVANRTAGARFSMEGKEYRLAANDGDNHLHGGPGGFHHKVWEVKSADKNSIVLKVESPDGDEGYPGKLTVQVSYTLHDDNSLQIVYSAMSDHDTPVNLTNHAYFNLKGSGVDNIDDHVLQINASQYLPIGPDFIPTGEIAEVGESPFDFRAPALLSDRLKEAHPQLSAGRGYDHHYICDGEGMRSVAKMTEPNSGRMLEVLTDLQGVQFYSGNFLDGTAAGKGGMRYGFRSGFCFEAQHYPNSLNEPSFPSIILKAGAEYSAKCIYRFGIVN